MGLALQLCALRYLGFVPRNLSAAPRSAACFVADQLEVSPDEIQSYARREQTRRQHFTEVREHLGFSMLRSRDLEELEAWLVERALEHEAPKILFRRARERLRTERLVFPAPDRSPDPVCPFFHVQDRSHKRANAPEKEAEDVRCAAGLAEPREWLEPSGRSGAGAGCSTRPSGLHRSRPPSGRVGGRERPPEVVYVCSVCTWKTRLNHRHLWINLTAAIA